MSNELTYIRGAAGVLIIQWVPIITWVLIRTEEAALHSTYGCLHIHREPFSVGPDFTVSYLLVILLGMVFEHVCMVFAREVVLECFVKLLVAWYI